MKDVLDAIIYFDELSEEQQRALRAEVRTNPELADVFQRWQHLRDHVRNSLNASLPDRELLVLYALQQRGETQFTPAEHSLLEQSSDKIQQAIRRHPALRDVVDDIQQAQSDFLQLWNEQIEPSTQPRQIPLSVRLPTARLFRLGAFRIAAVFLLLMLSLFSVFTILQQGRIETIYNAENENTTVRFEDGSTVRLIGETQLSYARPRLLTSFDRFVSLDGKAFFDIYPAREPFTVESATAITQATGTQFGIEADSSNTEVILANGFVTLSSKHDSDSKVTLQPGHASQVPLNAPPTEPMPVENMTEQMLWTGLFIFHASPLETVTSYLSDYFDVQIRIEESLKEGGFNATLDPDTLSLDEALGTLTMAFAATVDTLDEGSFYLAPSETR